MKFFACLLPFLLLAGCQGTQKSDGLAFVNVNIVDIEQGQILNVHTVVVRENRIVDIGPAAIISPPALAEVIDASGKFMIPGLWDMHVHTLLTFQVEGDSVDLPDTFFPLFIANGVTGVRDMNGGLDVLQSSGKR